MQKSDEDEEEREKKEDEEEAPDPLKQLITAFHRTAMTERTTQHEDFLYMAYAEIMSKSCHAQDGDDDDEGEEGDTGASFQVGDAFVTYLFIWIIDIIPFGSH
jgi:ryanodine receptor 1